MSPPRDLFIEAGIAPEAASAGAPRDLFAETGVAPRYKIGAEGLPDAVRAVAGDFNPLTQLAVGGKAAWDLAAMRAKQQFGGTLTPEQVNETRANRALIDESPMANMGNAFVNLGALGGPMASAYRGISAGASRLLPQALQFLAPTAGAVGSGALYSDLTQPVLQGESSAQNLKEGGMMSAGIDAALRGAARVAQPVIQSPQVQRLLAQDIVPTFGQSAGSEGGFWGGLVKNLEDKATSLPVVGNIINGARQRTLEEFNRAAFARTTPPGSAPNTTIGAEGVEAAKQKIGNAYEDIYHGVNVTRDNQLSMDFAAAAGRPTIPLSPAAQKKYTDIIDSVVTNRMPGGSKLPASDLKMTVESDLGKVMRTYKASLAPEDKAIGEALEGARDAFRALMARSISNPAKSNLLGATNQASGELQDVAAAVERARANQGLFTPNQLQIDALRGSPMRQLADDAQAVLPNRVANSGTFDRAALPWILGGSAAGGGAAAATSMPLLLTGAALSPLAYSRLGSQYAVGALPFGLGRLQRGTSGLLRDLAPYSGGGALYQP